MNILSWGGSKRLSRCACLLMCAFMLAVAACPAAAQTLKFGERGAAVEQAKQRLYELNYLNGGAKSAVEGSVADGVYGEGTAAAVAAFQRDHGLPETGIADSETQRLLLEGNQQS